MTGKHSELNDLDLIQRFRAGDKDALGELFRRYLPQAYGVALKYFRDPMESEDAVMQVFEKLHKDLFRHEVHNFKSWLHTVVRNHCLMELRKKKGLYTVPLDFVETVAGGVEKSSQHHHHDEKSPEERLIELEQAVKHLNTEQKTCIELFFMQQMSYKDIADKTGFTLLQIKSHIQNGKRNLKIFLEKHNDR